jgi:ethanolamine ammonia-lyase small subunit
MSYEEAAAKIFYFVKESFRLQYSGVLLKDHQNPGLIGE